MTSSIIARLAARRIHRRTVAELSALSDRQLADIGVRRMEIEAHARAGMAARLSRTPAAGMRPQVLSHAH